MYCNKGSWVRLGICIAIQKLYCHYGARARLDCIAIQWLAKPRYSRGWAAGARATGAGFGAGALGAELAAGRARQSAERSGHARQRRAGRAGLAGNGRQARGLARRGRAGA